MPKNQAEKKRPNFQGIYIDLSQRDTDEIDIKRAIDLNDTNTIAACLRRLAGGQISSDIINKLADYLDPAIENPLYKCGPKRKKKSPSETWLLGCKVIVEYLWLCKHREFARLILNSDNEAFFLIENSELWDADRNFAPQWQYPLSKRKREAVLFPKRSEIKDYVCDRYGIKSRTFDDMLAKHK